MTTISTGERPTQYVGARVQRVEDGRSLTGATRYLDDVELPRMLHAAFVRSPLAHARIVSIDTSAALELDGVAAVITGADLEPLVEPMVTTVARDEVLTARRHTLAVDKVRHVGDAVAVVLASSRYIAEDARDLVEVEYDELPAVVDPECAMEPGSPLVHDELETNNLAHIEESAGDPDAVFASAEHVFSKRFVIGRSTGAPIETRGVIAEWDPNAGHMTVWNSTQMPHLLRTLMAPVLRLPEGRLTVKTPHVGGGFGLKCHLFAEDIVIPAVARRVGRPVKWVEDRYENLATGSHSKHCVCDVSIAVDGDGRFLGFRGHFIADGGAYSSVPYTPLIDTMLAAKTLPGMYDVADIGYTLDNPMTNKCQIGAIRGVGFAVGQTAREVVIDDIARGLGIDPVELRLKNAIPDEPWVTALGQKYDGGSYRASIERAREAIGHDGFRARQEQARKEGRYLGIGFSPYVEPTGLGTAMAEADGFPLTFFDSANVVMDPDGSVVVRTGLHSHGQGHETTFAQVAADQLGVRIEDVRVVFGDTETTSYGMGTYASRSAVIGTGTIMIAAGDLAKKLRRFAGHLLEANPDDISLHDGNAFVVGNPEKSIPIPQLAGFAYFGGDNRPADVEEPALDVMRSYDPPETYSNGCVAAIVEVDVETGFITIDKLVSVEDCGIMINPMIVDGQVSGAIAQAVGSTLYEDLVYDDDGQFLSGNLADYLLPSTSEVPTIDIEHIETPSTATLGGVKGMGEAGMIGAPAALINAVSDALSPFGVTVAKTPVTPDYVLALLRDRRNGA